MWRTNRGRLTVAFVIEGVDTIGGRQFDHLFDQAGAQEVAHAGKAAVAGLLDADAERDAAFGQQCRQPAARIAAIEQQQILRAEPIDLIGRGGTRGVTGAQPKAHGSGVGRDQTQAMPTWDLPVALGACQQPVVQIGQRGVGQLGASTSESLLGNLVRETGLLPKMSEELIEFGVDAFTHPAQHDSQQRGQWQLATAAKRSDMVAVTGAFMKLRGMLQCGEIRKQRGPQHGRSTKIKNDLHWPPPCPRNKPSRQGGGRAKCLNCQAFLYGCSSVPIRPLVKLGGLGLIPLSLHVPIGLYIAAACLPPLSEPANKKFFRQCIYVHCRNNAQPEIMWSLHGTEHHGRQCAAPCKVRCIAANCT